MKPLYMLDIEFAKFMKIKPNNTFKSEKYLESAKFFNDSFIGFAL
jgi:hypothetical protein